MHPQTDTLNRDEITMGHMCMYVATVYKQCIYRVRMQGEGEGERFENEWDKPNFKSGLNKGRKERQQKGRKHLVRTRYRLDAKARCLRRIEPEGLR